MIHMPLTSAAENGGVLHPLQHSSQAILNVSPWPCHWDLRLREITTHSLKETTQMFSEDCGSWWLHIFPLYSKYYHCAEWFQDPPGSFFNAWCPLCPGLVSSLINLNFHLTVVPFYSRIYCICLALKLVSNTLPNLNPQPKTKILEIRERSELEYAVTWQNRVKVPETWNSANEWQHLQKLCQGKSLQPSLSDCQVSLTHCDHPSDRNRCQKRRRGSCYFFLVKTTSFKVFLILALVIWISTTPSKAHVLKC